MKFYHSGVAKPPRGQALSKEFLMLREAGVRHILVDQFQLRGVGDYRTNLGLDCGSYYASKHTIVIDLPPYLDLARNSGPFDFSVALDAVGNPQLSHNYWLAIKRLGRPENMMAVWQWGGPREHLEEYLSECPVVGIGGLVNLMRGKDEKMRRELLKLCERYPRRFHIFALNWLRCFKDFAELAYSADSSKWLDGARKGTVIFENSRNGHLAQMPEHMALAQGIIDRAMTREERCILSARNMDAFTNRGPGSPDAAHPTLQPPPPPAAVMGAPAN